MDIKRIFLLVAAAFLILSVWNSPTATATAFADFLGDVGSFLEDAIDKFTEFFRGLTA
jgi:cell shape-determining protein MreC